MEKFQMIMELFGVGGTIADVRKLGLGHINETYRIIYSAEESYILQKINRDVFKAPDMIMKNIEMVCSCLDNTLEFLKAEGKSFILSDESLWRAYKYVSNSVSSDALESADSIYSFGKVLGRFHSATKDLDISEIYDTIPGFHNTTGRIKRVQRLTDSSFEEINSFMNTALEYARELDEKNLPRHVTHGDAKCSNVLFDRDSGRAVMMIDLDTVMPGLWVHDFGDGARSACVTRGELDTEKYSAFASGYLSENRETTGEDCFLGTVCICAELAARYFYDYLSGENYFADKTPAQKLERCRQLVTLGSSVIRKKEEMIRAAQFESAENVSAH